MKDKIRKFYEEHKAELLITLGVVLTATGAVAYHKNAIDGMSIEGINEYNREDGVDTLIAFRKNGTTQSFRRADK